jgi:hypothetical protein
MTTQYRVLPVVTSCLHACKALPVQHEYKTVDLRSALSITFIPQPTQIHWQDSQSGPSFLRCTSPLLSFFSPFLPSPRLHRRLHLAGCLFLLPGARSCTRATMSPPSTPRSSRHRSVFTTRSLLYCARTLTSGWLPENLGAPGAGAIPPSPRAREIPWWHRGASEPLTFANDITLDLRAKSGVRYSIVSGLSIRLQHRKSI